MTHALYHALYANAGVPTADPRFWSIKPAQIHRDGQCVAEGKGVVSSFEFKAFGTVPELEAVRAAAVAVYDLMTPKVERLAADHMAIEGEAYATRRAVEAAARATYNEATQASREAAGAASQARWSAILSVLPPKPEGMA